jgi:hypothetical protein
MQYHARLAALEVRGTPALTLALENFNVVYIDYIAHGITDEGRAISPGYCMSGNCTPDMSGGDIVRILGHCKANGLKCAVLRFLNEEHRDTAGVQNPGHITFAIGIQVPFSLCDSYRYGPYAANPCEPETRELKVSRLSYGISRFSRVPPGRDAPQWDDVDEVWARALPSKLPFWKALNVEAKKMVAEYMEREVRNGTADTRFGVELIEPVSFFLDPLPSAGTAIQ